MPFVSGAGGSVWPAMHGRRGVVCARRLYVTVVCVHYADGFFDRAGAGACVGGSLVWRRSTARWRLRPTIGCAIIAVPCMPQRIPDRAVTFIVFYFFLGAN